MKPANTTDIAVIGGGVIGLSCALRLAEAGREVTLIEPNALGSGASYGNAGTIAEYGIIPIGTPATLRNLPSLLFGRESPLSIRRAALGALAPWLAKFVVQSMPHNARRNVEQLVRLLAEASADWKELAAQIDATHLFNPSGALYLYKSQAAFAAASSDISLRRKNGIGQEMLTADEVAKLEPALPPFAGGGVYFPNAIHLRDPGQVMARLAKATISSGVNVITATVDNLKRGQSCVHLTGKNLDICAKHVVIAAGAFSKPLAQMAGEAVPLDTERGYHVEYDMEQPLLSRPVSPTERGLYLVPMQGRLRAVGTIELGGLTAPPNQRRLDLIDRAAKSIFPTLGAPSRTWMGFRPSMPNSVPVIRPSRGGNDIIFAFGHGHLGLTLAPITARLVSDMVR
ncbi:MAG: FAD-dependent oxidoreductase [Robiginitomaculum sp.]|nr:MAG: FAD-dependent oxidoreductase [Robiginitomaculum sp.]